MVNYKRIELVGEKFKEFVFFLSKPVGRLQKLAASKKPAIAKRILD